MTTCDTCQWAWWIPNRCRLRNPDKGTCLARKAEGISRCLPIKRGQKIECGFYEPFEYNWIPVNQNLPPVGGNGVLVTDGEVVYPGGLVYIDGKYQWAVATDSDIIPVVTHWQPCPELPIKITEEQRSKG